MNLEKGLNQRRKQSIVYFHLKYFFFIFFKEHPHSADKKTSMKKFEDKTGRNTLENLLEIYEQTYVKEMEKIVKVEKKDSPSPVVQKKERKNKSFHDFSRKKPQTTDTIKETSEEIAEEFSFKDIKEQDNTTKSSKFKLKFKFIFQFSK